MRAIAFLVGMYEFRRSFTTRYDDERDEAYDRGREWAHQLTLRRFEQ